MKKSCESLREHTVKIINFKKKKMKLLAKEQHESYENARICYICEENFENKCLKDKKYPKVRDHCHYTGEQRGAAHSSGGNFCYQGNSFIGSIEIQKKFYLETFFNMF